MGRITGRSDSNSEFNWMGVPQWAVITIVEMRSLDFVKEVAAIIVLYVLSIASSIFSLHSPINVISCFSIMSCNVVLSISRE